MVQNNGSKFVEILKYLFVEIFSVVKKYSNINITTLKSQNHEFFKDQFILVIETKFDLHIN